MVFGLDGAPLPHAFHPLGAAAASSCKPSQAAGLQEFLGALRRRFGVVLFAAQLGEAPPYAKPPKGFGGTVVLELINTVERTIRPIKPGHENHLFAGSDGSAESSNSPPDCRATTPHRSRRSTNITRQLPACWHQTIGDPTPAFPRVEPMG
jgi:hypothetical protein